MQDADQETGSLALLLETAGKRRCQQAAADVCKVMKLNRHHSVFKQGARLEAAA